MADPNFKGSFEGFLSNFCAGNYWDIDHSLARYPGHAKARLVVGVKSIHFEEELGLVSPRHSNAPFKNAR
jgi:hypothetical protein